LLAHVPRSERFHGWEGSGRVRYSRDGFSTLDEAVFWRTGRVIASPDSADGDASVLLRTAACAVQTIDYGLNARYEKDLTIFGVQNGVRFRLAISRHMVGKNDVSCVGISSSGYYVWAGCAESRRTTANRRLLDDIRSIHIPSGGAYGSPRVDAALQRGGSVSAAAELKC
jgi:hypothetical protein